MIERTKHISVLHIDDDPEFAELVSKFLQKEDDRFSIETATHPSDGMDLLLEEEIECVVCDYELPSRDGIELLESIRTSHPNLPFILYTGRGSEAVASDAISAGVTDYLQKSGSWSQIEVLANKIRNAVETYRTQIELAERERQLNLFFEKSPLGVIQWDDEFTIVRLNEAAEEILGYTENELAGESWEILIPRDIRDEIEDEVITTLLEDEGGFHRVNENLRKDGQRIICEWHNWTVTNEEGEVSAIFAQFEEVSDENGR